MTVEEDIYDKFIPAVTRTNSCRLSIRNKRFHKVVNREEETLSQEGLKIVIVKTSCISRAYYAQSYGDGKSTIPACWCANCKTGVPSPNVLASNKQNPHCFDCKQNIKGSGKGSSLACSFRHRLGVALLDENGTLDGSNVFRLDIPANSIFPKDSKKMSLRTYAQVLNTNKTPVASIVTELQFDSAVDIPKLIFKPLRALERKELETVYQLQNDPDIKELVNFDFKPKANTPMNTDNIFDVVQGEGVYTKEI